MGEPALKIELPAIRRFYVADLTESGPWIMDRLLKTYPNQNQRSIIGWLNGVIDNNEFLCLYLPHCVCFAERYCPDMLTGKMWVREKFIWVEDPSDADQITSAVEFYPFMMDWARHQSIDRVVVHERSDVPIERMRERLGGKLHEYKTMFARV